MIEVKGFFVFCPGDISAGIFNQEWKIDGEFFFDDEKELNQFKDALKEAWSWYSDPIMHKKSETSDTMSISVNIDFDEE